MSQRLLRQHEVGRMFDFPKARASEYDDPDVVLGLKPPPVGQAFVYFIQSGEGGPIKIGYAADPNAQLRDLQTAQSEPLSLLGSIPGDQALERRLHKRFRRSHIRGEWFKPSYFLRRFIAENA